MVFNGTASAGLKISGSGKLQFFFTIISSVKANLQKINNKLYYFFKNWITNAFILAVSVFLMSQLQLHIRGLKISGQIYNFFITILLNTISSVNVNLQKLNNKL